MESQSIATFSIVAYDPDRKEWGVAVQSKFLAVGAVVPWAKAGVGAIATQSYANPAYGPDGLALMAQGMSAADTLKALIEPDEGRALRQVGAVDAQGQAAAFSGEECHEWSGHIVGEGYACQGNILVPGTVEAMSAAFEKLRTGPGELANWLVATLMAGQEAGGDSRGRQSAAVLVVREGGGYAGNNDRYLDLRVDDDPYPIQKLKKLVSTHHLYFGSANPDELILLADVAAELQTLLQRTGHYDGPASGVFDDVTRDALYDLIGHENLEGRWDGTGDKIDRLLIAYVRDKFA